MARSQEKAMTTLNRWVDQRRAVESGSLNISRRPRFAHECKTIREGEMWRAQIVRDLSSLISQVQNAGLGEQRLREMNDEINRLLRSKYAWEMQIKRLGGPDYSAQGAKVGDGEGMELPGGGGYRYFGAAKHLPGVRELFEQELTAEAGPARKTRKQLMENITPDYYGFRDEEDPNLLQEEAEVERIEREKIRQAIVANGGAVHLPAGHDSRLVAMSVPNQEELDRIILEKKKQMLLQRYTALEGHVSQFASAPQRQQEEEQEQQQISMSMTNIIEAE